MSEIKRYDTFGEGEFMYPTEDGGYVRFDEHQSAIDRLTEERDAAVADAERWITWIRCVNRKSFNLTKEIAEIDAAMKEKEQGK